MPIRKYIPGATFGPETIRDMTTAFEQIRVILNLEKIRHCITFAGNENIIQDD